MITTHNLGFPRIGAHREMKESVEGYWKGLIDREELEERGRRIREANLLMQSALDLVPVGDFSWYDHVLDMSLLLGVIPSRFKNTADLDTYFQMARGGKEVHPCEMTKWFDTNYHYIVPEFSEDQPFKISHSKLFNEVKEAQALGYRVKPVLLGPLSYLWLGECRENGFDKLELLDRLVNAYKEILSRLCERGVEWVQIDEPILTLDLPEEWTNAFSMVYQNIHTEKIKILLTTYFGSVEHHASLICKLPVAGVHLDLVSAPLQISPFLGGLNPSSVLSVGIVNGRNIWRCPSEEALSLLMRLRQQLGARLWIAGSCSLMHIPVDVELEEGLCDPLKNRLAFALQKIEELTNLRKVMEAGGYTGTTLRPTVFKKQSEIVQNISERSPSFTERQKEQRKTLSLPLFPTTTVGSFPQTPEIRAARRDFKQGFIDERDYNRKMKEEIAYVIQKQETLGLDVLVHGEPERNDMVEYFAEQLEGFALTQHGWVQSYGSRCVKPPIIHGDILRTHPLTVEWSRYAQSLTEKPVKGMLTGPTTMICWSFIREDQPKLETTRQMALVLRDEAVDLVNAGIRVIQIDEPALREGLPLRRKDWKNYLDGAVSCFKIASMGVKNSVQIHAHMCYSEFNDIVDAIAGLDADVISIESSRSNMELLKAFETFHYPNSIGPGVYDIHSPRIPPVEEIVSLLEKAVEHLPFDRLWVNPDCGLKTREWNEVEKALHNMVAAAGVMRKKYNKESDE